MDQILQDFLVFLRSEYHYSDNTVAAYRNDLNQFYEFLTAQFPDIDTWVDITPNIIDVYVDDLKNRDHPYAASSIARKVAAVKSFFNYLHARGFIPTNPTNNIDSPKVKKRLPKTLASKEIEFLLMAPQKGSTPKHLRDTALLNMLYATGMRVSEVVNLELDDVSHQRGETFITFLEHLLVDKYPTGRLVLVLDRASYHKSAAALAALSLFEQRILIVWLPAYCTELNPIERFWRHLKDLACANQLWSCLDEVIEKVEQVLHQQNTQVDEHRFMLSKNI